MSEGKIDPQTLARDTSMRIFDIRKAPDDRQIPGSERYDGERMASGDVPFHKEERVVLYCGSGNSCSRIAVQLRKEGYDTVALEGGYAAWKRRGCRRKHARVYHGCRGQMAMVRTALVFAALAIAASRPLICLADPGTAPAPVMPPVPRQLTVTNVGQPAIVHLSVSPMQSIPSSINVLSQPLHSGTAQTIAIPAAQQCCYDIKAVYSDGHTVTIPFWSISNIPIITIPH
jgi:rhodanese-related sulfurtransferase